MKLTTVTHITLDGVVQGLGGLDEDRRGGFERGGWAIPFFGDQAAAYLDQVFRRADAFLFGRWTYEVFAGYWGAIDDPGNVIAAALNRQPKFVVSSTLTDPQWTETTVLSGDLAAAVAQLKEERDGELQVHGSITLVRWLLEQGLVDEIVLLAYPLVLGQGTRLFPENGPDMRLELVDSAITPSGIIVQAYRPNGRPEYAPGGTPAD